MPHLRKRHILPRLKTALQHSPIVGLFGHRQVGKTTLLEKISNQYITLDIKESRVEAEKDSPKFLQKYKTSEGCLGIDECQWVPDLFPALKESVRKDKRPGSFLLSGSVRFTSRKAIQESLTGRILSLELSPLTVSEISGLELSDFLKWTLTVPEFTESRVRNRLVEKRIHTQKIKDIESYKTKGGLPGVCFIREGHTRKDAISNLLRTIFERDLPLVQRTLLPTSAIMDFAHQVAASGWAPLNHQELRRESGIAHVTQKKILYAMESVFLLRALRVEGDFKGPIYLFEDQLEQHFLSHGKLSEEEVLVGLLFRNLRAQFQYESGFDCSPFVYLTRGGATVPIAFRSDSGVVGFIPFLENQPTLSQRRSADSFLRHYTQSKIVFVSSKIHRPTWVDSRSMIADVATVI